MNEKKKIVTAVVITAVVSSIITFTASTYLTLASSSSSEKSFLSKLKMIDAILDSKYLYDFDKEELRENAIRGYVDGLDEPYTEYYTPEEYSSYTDNLMDGYIGIGVIVGVNDDDMIEIIAPFEGSPAYDAGIKPGDILKAVDGTDYGGSELSEAVSMIRGGKEGTTVDITIVRDGEEINLTVERRDISDDSVKAEMLGDGIGYMRITQFNMESEDGEHSTSSEFKKYYDNLKSQGMDRLIIDLRDNPGGLLPEVCKIADMLLPEGIITYIEDKNGKREDFTSDAESAGIPMAVLINGNSASASEVLTGALKDYGIATIVGTTSYGKGIVQDVYTLPDGSGISLTTAQYFTPNGVCIHGVGIEPDVMVEMPDEYKDTYASAVERSKDTQLQEAIKIIKEK